MKPFIYKFGLQQQYDNLKLKNGQTMYIITDTHKIYIGDQLYAAGGSSVIDPSNIDLSDYATKNYVTTAINAIDLPSKISKKNPAPTGMLAKFTSEGDIESSSIAATDVSSAMAAANNITIITQTAYDALDPKIKNRIYVTSDTNKIYIGDKEYTSDANTVGDYIPIIAATPTNANENKIPLITDVGTLKPSTYTLQGLIDYFIGAGGFLTKDDLTVLTQAEYDELQEINPNTIYMTTDTQKIYMGARQHTSGTSELSRILFSQNATSSSIISADLEKELFSYSPLAFNTSDTNLIDFVIYGNGGNFNLINYELVNTGDITWVQGSIDNSGVDYSRTDRIRSSFMTIPTSGDYLFNFYVKNNINLKIVAFIYDSNETFLYKIPASNWTDSNGTFSLPNLQSGNKIKIIFAYEDYTTTIQPSIIINSALFKIGSSTNTQNLTINISNGTLSRNIELDVQSLASGEILQLSDFNIDIPTYVGNNVLTVGINPPPRVYIRYKE